MELFKLNTPAALRIPQNWLFSELADSVKQSWMKRGTPTSRCQHYHLLPCFPCCPRASFILLPIFLSCCCQYFFPFVVNICFILLPIFVSVANICYCCQYLLLLPIFVIVANICFIPLPIFVNYLNRLRHSWLTLYAWSRRPAT